MKDYSTGRVAFGPPYSLYHVRAFIREACAEAIADTKRKERRRAANIAGAEFVGPRRTAIMVKILGKEPRRGSR